jgi:serine/threonine protein kinase
MMKLEDSSILERDAEDEFNYPLPQKYCEDGRVIYLARNDYGQFARDVGILRITDFDLAVSGSVPRKGCIQAGIYRAPEVILDVGYTYSADIWSLGVMVSGYIVLMSTTSLTMSSFGICWKRSLSSRTKGRKKCTITTIRSISLS